MILKLNSLCSRFARNTFATITFARHKFFYASANRILRPISFPFSFLRELSFAREGSLSERAILLRARDTYFAPSLFRAITVFLRNHFLSGILLRSGALPWSH